MQEIDYKKKCEQYEKVFGIGEYDPVKDAYIVYIKMLNQQVEFLSEFNIKSNIGELDKESPKYKRAMDMIDGLPKMMTTVSDLKGILKLTKEDIKNIQPDKQIFSRITTPETIADNIGELAGRNEG